MENKHAPYAEIKGWGVDADPRNEPTYPMKHYTGDDHKRLHYDRPTQQEGDIELLMSIERPSRSAVFGTSVPPSGLSGAIRRLAFKFSESEYGHWLPLLLADRINVVEGIIQDISHGKLPNLIEELGLRGEWTYNRKGLAKRVAITTAVTAGTIALLMWRSSSKKKNKGWRKWLR